MQHSSTPAEGITYPGWLVVIGCALALSTSSGAVVAFALSLFLGPIGREFGWSSTAVSLGLSVMTLTLAISAPFAGRAFDRFGIRRTLLFVIPAFALSVGLMGVMPASYPAYLALLALSGVLGAFHSSIPYVKVVAEWFDWRRGLALGLTMSGVGLGGIILTQTVSKAMQWADWRAGFFAMSGVILLVGVVATLGLVRERPVMAGDSRPVDEPFEGLTVREAVGDFRFWAILAFVLSLNMTVNGISASGAAVLEWKGLRGAEIAGAVSLMAAASLAGRLLIGLMLDRIHAPRVGALLCGTSLIALGVLAYAESHPAVLAGLALVGFSLGAETDVIGFMISRYCGLRNFGALFGIMLGVFSLAPAVGIPLLGLSFDQSGSYRPAMLAFAIVVLASTLVLQFLGPYRFRRQRPG